MSPLCATVKIGMKIFYKVTVGFLLIAGASFLLMELAYYVWTRSNFVADYYNYVVLGGKNLRRIPQNDITSLSLITPDESISALLKSYPLKDGYGTSLGGANGLISISGDIASVDREKLALYVDSPSIADSATFTDRKITVWLLSQTGIEVDRIEKDKIKHVPVILTFWKYNFTKFNKHVFVIATHGWLNRLYALSITIKD